MKAKFIIPCIALAIAALMGTACSCQQLDGDRVPTKNFIQEYLIPESLSYSSYSDEFHFDGIWISDGAALERMLEKYGDTVYNRAYYKPTYAVSADFKKIEITSDMDFDSGHKAGESLADIVMFHGKSPWEFIQAGCPDSWIMESKEFKRIDKKVSEITPEDLKFHHRIPPPARTAGNPHNHNQVHRGGSHGRGGLRNDFRIGESDRYRTENHRRTEKPKEAMRKCTASFHSI